MSGVIGKRGWTYEPPVDVGTLPDWINALTWRREADGRLFVETRDGWIPVFPGDTILQGKDEGNEAWVYGHESYVNASPRLTDAAKGEK